MEELIKLLFKDLEYLCHEVIDDTIYISLESSKKLVICPYCQRPSEKVHSYYKRSFQDLPIQGKKVIYIINNKKMFCNNPDCEITTFAETFEFLGFKAKKSKRLEDEIMNISVNMSSLAAEQLLKTSVGKVGKSTICNILKKRSSCNR